MRVLLVEDQRDAARMTAKGLREQAYAVDIVTDGDAACHEASVSISIRQRLTLWYIAAVVVVLAFCPLVSWSFTRGSAFFGWIPNSSA